MANYPPVPPAPPGGGYPPGAGGPPMDPYAAERVLGEWATARGYTLGNTPEWAWYQAWYPFVYVFRFARLGRELRVPMGEANALFVEAFEADPLKQATGEDRYLMAFVTSPRITARVALRAKTGGGVVNEVSRGLGSLFGAGGSPGGVLGDPALETRYEVQAPSREEGNRALPIPVRQFLFQTMWRGVLETRPGGLACVLYDRKAFDVPTLEWAVATVKQLHDLCAGAV